jgi:hypothetical protein
MSESWVAQEENAGVIEPPKIQYWCDEDSLTNPNPWITIPPGSQSMKRLTRQWYRHMRQVIRKEKEKFHLEDMNFEVVDDFGSEDEYSTDSE